MAYCFITIPSMVDIFQKLKLYLLSGQVALANQAVGQGKREFFFLISTKACFTLGKTFHKLHVLGMNDDLWDEHLGYYRVLKIAQWHGTCSHTVGKILVLMNTGVICIMCPMNC